MGSFWRGAVAACIAAWPGPDRISLLVDGIGISIVNQDPQLEADFQPVGL
jgi:hypothetical protein